MKIVVLQRADQNNRRTYGRFELEDGTVIVPFTLEEPWRDLDQNGISDRNISCIPAGEYELVLRKSHQNGGTGGRDYDVWELIGVPGRDNVQIHIGNDLDDTEGCILVGMRRSEQKELDEKGYVIGSEPAHTAWMQHMKGLKRARLIVRNPECRAA